MSNSDLLASTDAEIVLKRQDALYALTHAPTAEERKWTFDQAAHGFQGHLSYLQDENVKSAKKRKRDPETEAVPNTEWLPVVV